MGLLGNQVAGSLKREHVTPKAGSHRWRRLSEGGDPLTQNQGLGWMGGPCTAKSGTRAPLGGAPSTLNLVRPSGPSQISMPRGLPPEQQRCIRANLPEGPALHRGQCLLTRMFPPDSCRQCRASSWLVPAPGKMLEQAAVSRSSTGFKGAQERVSMGRGKEITYRAGLGRAGPGLGLGLAYPPTQQPTFTCWLGSSLTLPLFLLAAL